MEWGNCIHSDKIYLPKPTTNNIQSWHSRIMPVQFTGSIQHCSGAPRMHRKTDKIHNNKKIRENQICFNSECYGCIETSRSIHS